MPRLGIASLGIGLSPSLLGIASLTGVGGGGGALAGLDSSSQLSARVRLGSMSVWSWGGPQGCQVGT